MSNADFIVAVSILVIVGIFGVFLISYFTGE